MFKKLKSLGKKALPYIAALSIGLSGVYCGDSEVIYKKYSIPSIGNHTPAVITRSLEDAVAGEYYTQKIEVSDFDGDNLEVSLVGEPDGMVIEKIEKNIYELKWSPVYSKLTGTNSQTGNFNFDINVSDGINGGSKVFNLNVLDNSVSGLSYLRTDENIKFVCQSPCLSSKTSNVEIKKESLDEFSKGVFNAVKTLRDVVKSDAPLDKKPVEYAVSRYIDNTNKLCDLGDRTNLSSISDGRYLICNPGTYDANGNMLIRSNANSLDAIENHWTGIHEYTHSIFNHNPESKPGFNDGSKTFQEHFCSAIAEIITDGSGYPDSDNLNSFCDSRFEPSGTRSYSPILPHYLCINFGFDINDLPDLFRELKTSTNTDVQNAKCKLDKIMKKNTYPAFDSTNIYTADIRYNPFPIFPKIIVEDKYCEDD